MTTRYSQLFGEHPFEKNGFATLNGRFVWGGMENQTLTSLCPNCWDESLISHEYRSPVVRRYDHMRYMGRYLAE